MNDKHSHQAENIKHILRRYNNEAVVVPGCDNALMGIATNGDGRHVAAYDMRKFVECFQKQGMTQEDAVEWVDVNCTGVHVNGSEPVLVELFNER